MNYASLRTYHEHTAGVCNLLVCPEDAPCTYRVPEACDPHNWSVCGEAFGRHTPDTHEYRGERVK